MRTEAAAVARSVKTIGSLPTVCLRLTEAVNDPRCSTARIAEIVEGDSGLSARLLRLANSPFFGFPSRIDTVARAVALIGTEQLCDLALATSVIEAFDGFPSDLVNLRLFWRHSLACGVAARALARQRREPNAERHFAQGILHDVGSLILYTTQPDVMCECLERCWQSGELVHVVEHATLGFTHATVAAELFETWNLPQAHREAVRWHHDPASARRFPIDAALIHVGDIIAHALGHPSGERLVPALRTEAWTLLDLSPAILPPVLEEIEQQYAAAVAVILRDASG